MPFIRSCLLLTAAFVGLSVLAAPAFADTQGVDTTQGNLPFKINGNQIMNMTGAGLAVNQGSVMTGSNSYINAQGAFLQWNRNNGDGATWIANQQGGGAGGMYFGYADTANHFYEQMRLAANNGTSQSMLFVDGEVAGQLSGVSPYSQFRMYASPYSSMWRNDGANTYLLLTAANDLSGVWNGLRPFYVNDSNGMVNMSNGLSMVGNTSITVSDDTRNCNASTAGTIKFTNGVFYGCNGTSWTLLSQTNGGPPNKTASTPHCQGQTLADGTIQMSHGGGNFVNTRVINREVVYYDGTPNYANYSGGSFVCVADKDGLSEASSDPMQYYFTNNYQVFSPWQ